MANRYAPPLVMPRLLDKLSIGGVDACWEWHGAKSDGYGRIRCDGKRDYTHRVMWERMRGPIPKGLQIDHLCRNRACANPKHMELVDIRTNVLRGVGLSAQNARKTHCPQGHEYTPENTRLSQGKRQCRTCERVFDQRRRATT